MRAKIRTCEETTGGTSAVLLLVETILLRLVKYSRAPRWAPDVLTGPEIVIHESLKGFERLISAVLLLLQGNSRGGAGDLQKTLRCLSQHR